MPKPTVEEVRRLVCRPPSPPSHVGGRPDASGACACVCACVCVPEPGRQKNPTPPPSLTLQPPSPPDGDTPPDAAPPLPTTPGAGRLDPSALLPDRAIADVLASLDPSARLAPDAGATLARVAADFVSSVLDAALASTAARRGTC